MSKVGRAIYWQVGALVAAVALALVLSRFFPIFDFVEALQGRVMGWGPWGAICYPLLFRLVISSCFRVASSLLVADFSSGCGGDFLSCLRAMSWRQPFRLRCPGGSPGDGFGEGFQQAQSSAPCNLQWNARAGRSSS